MVTTMIDIIFWDFSILYQIFFSPQVNQSVISSNKHGIWELPHELLNELFADGGAFVPTQEKKKKT